MNITARVRNSYFLALAATVLLLSGCAALRYKTAESPRVSVTGLQLGGFSIFEQRFDIGLRLQNPNDFALPITGMDFQLFVEGNAVASGVSNNSITVPAFGEEEVSVAITGNLLSTLSQLQRWRQAGKNELGYRVEGRLKMADVPVKIPFEQTGTFDLRQQAGK